MDVYLSDRARKFKWTLGVGWELNRFVGVTNLSWCRNILHPVEVQKILPLEVLARGNAPLQYLGQRREIDDSQVEQLFQARIVIVFNGPFDGLSLHKWKPS